MGSRDGISEAKRSQVPRPVPCPPPCESFAPEVANPPAMEATWSACRTRRGERRNDRTDVCWPRHQSHGANQPDSGGEEVAPRWRTRCLVLRGEALRQSPSRNSIPQKDMLLLRYRYRELDSPN